MANLVTPEFMASCQIVLGADDLPTILSAALREHGPRPWERVMAVNHAMRQLRQLEHPTPDAMTAIFERCCHDESQDTRRKIAEAVADIERAVAEALIAEAAELRAFAARRHAAND